MPRLAFLRHTLLLCVFYLSLFCGDAVVRAESVTIFAVDYPIVAYVVASKDAVTTYAIACAAGSDESDCGFVQPYTLIEGPKTLRFQFTAPQGASSQSLTLACDLQGTTSMNCNATGLSNDSPSMPPVTTTQALTYTGTAAAGLFGAVPLVTNRAALMTYTPGVSSSSSNIETTSLGNATMTALGAQVTSAIVVATSTQAVNDSGTTATTKTTVVSTNSSATPSNTLKSEGVVHGVRGWHLSAAVVMVIAVAAFL